MDRAFFVPVLDDDPCAEAVGQKVFDALERGGQLLLGRRVPISFARRAPGFREVLGGEFFRNPDRCPPADDLFGEPFLLVVRLEREEDLRVADGNPVVFEKGLDVGMQIEEPHRIGDRGPAFSHAF